MIRTNKTHRFFTTMVSVCSLIVLLSLSTTAFAYTEFAGGDGTEENPYLIENQDHLDCVRNHLDAHFRMTEDVIFTPEDFSEEGFFWQGWSPIGDAEAPFTGTFDGNGHKIVGLYQNTAASETAYMGLFGYTDSASIKNLSMDSSKFTLSTTKGSAYAGGIVGYAVNTYIENCANTGTITAETPNSAATYALAGGLAGFAKGTEFVGCCNTGAIIATTGVSSRTHGAGAIAGGTAGCAISDCYNTGVLRATSSKGRASVHDGPFVGVRFAHSAPWTASYTVKTSYNIGKMLGRKDVANYEDYCVYYNDEGTRVELSVLELCAQLTYEGFDFTDVWQMGNGDAYLMPTLQWFDHPAVPVNTTDFDGGTGMIFDPYLVSTKEHLDHVRDYPQGYFKLTEDIVFTEEDFAETGAFYNDGQGWLSIGDAEVPFIGTFDGNGHTIQGLYQSSTKAHNDYYGLFGNAEGIEIRDLNVADSSISITYVGASNVYTGFLVGRTTNCMIENCLSTGMLTASSNKISSLRFGGILGSGKAVNLIDCSNAGSLSYTGSANAYFGGIMGEGNGTITNCRNMGAISVKAGAGMVGGIVASGNDIAITSCSNTGTLTFNGQYSGGTGDVGGIAGRGGVCAIKKCYNAGAVTIGPFEYNVLAGGIAGYVASGSQVSDCYNIGTVAASNGRTPSAYSGGILGSAASGTVTNCYNTAQVTAKAGGMALAGAIVGSNSSTLTNCYYLNNCDSGVGSGTDTTKQYNTAQMKKERMYEGFDFAEIWQMGDGDTYEFPVLRGLPTGHSLHKIAETAATCTSEGNEEYWTCYLCGQHFADAEGSFAVESGSWIIPAKEHIDDENDSDHACDVCGKEDVSTHTPGDEWLEDENFHWHICTVSGCGKVVESTKAPHTPDHEGGATEEYAVKCTVCDYVMEQPVIHSHVFDKQVADSKYLKYSADCERAAAYYYSCACGQMGDETFDYGSANGHTYIYGVCHCGDDILPEIAYDEGTGVVELEEIPSEVRRVIVAVYTGEKMLYGTVAGDDPVVIPVVMRSQADCIRVFYLDDQYTPVLMAGYHRLINR